MQTNAGSSLQDKHISTLTSLYLLLRLLHVVHHKTLVNSIGASLLRTEQVAPVDVSPARSPDLVDNGGSIGREAKEAGEESDDSTALPTTSEEPDGRYVLHLRTTYIKSYCVLASC